MTPRFIPRPPGALRGAGTLFLFAVNTMAWTLPLLAGQLLKLTLPFDAWRRFWSRFQNGIGTAWISFNNLTLRVGNPARWDVEGLEGLRSDRWYLVVANHRSWVDILVLQRVFNRRIPFLKFLLKKELFWVPFLGLAWWALDYPFLERSSRPDRDLEAIRKAADRFRLLPVSVMNFVEGTRFTPEKHSRQRSPYRHLLKPKAGGLVFLLSTMGEEIHSVLDVTIAYRDETPSLWGFFCGRTREVTVRVEEIPVGPELTGDFREDKAFRRRFSTWLRDLWAAKDGKLTRMSGEVSSQELTGGS